jgi:ADP-ribose pyrophosphatase YjhB (NUDIX family)
MIESRVLVWLLLEQDGGVLVARRKGDAPPFAGQWTLPGDVMAMDESASETIARCGREQLDVTVRSEDFVATLDLEDDGGYAVNVFRVGFLGKPRFRESGPYDEVRWALPSDFDDPAVVMPDALREMLRPADDGSST